MSAPWLEICLVSYQSLDQFIYPNPLQMRPQQQQKTLNLNIGIGQMHWLQFWLAWKYDVKKHNTALLHLCNDVIYSKEAHWMYK